MRAALLTGIRQLEIGSLPEPQITGAREVLVRVGAVGVCGSDIHYYTQGAIGEQRICFPATLGHECAGTVGAVGAGVTSLRAGARVAVDPLIPCGRCDQCIAGRAHTCRHQKFLGCPGQAPGALAEFIVIPETCCFPIPDSMTMEQAAMVEPFAIALYAARMAADRAGIGQVAEAKIAVLGAGPIGLSTLLACRALTQCAVYATDLVESRVEAARRCGAGWAGSAINSNVAAEIIAREPLGLDAVFECAGKQEALDQAIEILKPGGALFIIGIPETERVSFRIHELRRKEIGVWNVRRQNGCTMDAIAMIASGRVRVDPLITHRLPLSAAKAAFDQVTSYRDGVVKAMIAVSREAERDFTANGLLKSG